MINETKLLLDTYYNWLKEKTILTQIKDWVEITTPYLDRHNDYIQIYIKKIGNSFVLTDDGYTIGDLLKSGVNFSSPKRSELLKITLNGFGVSKEGNALCVNTNMDDFPLKKHNLVQAMLAVNDMFYSASAHVSSLFFEDVKEWINHNDIRYTENAIFKGKSGFDRKFDFVIPKSKTSSERLVKVINELNKTTTDLFIIDWLDTKDIRPEQSKAFLVANDINKVLPSSSLEALKHYEINPIPWSEREIFKGELSA
jgi:hypothetical protein